MGYWAVKTVLTITGAIQRNLGTDAEISKIDDNPGSRRREADSLWLGCFFTGSSLRHPADKQAQEDCPNA